MSEPPLPEPPLTRAEALARADQHEQWANVYRVAAALKAAQAQKRERWARRWREWGSDDSGTVPYPGDVGR